MDALILAGGVAKGAFTSGALASLFDPAQNPAPPRVRRIVAASSGALNAAYLASAVQRCSEATAGFELESIWLEHASAARAFAPNLVGMLSLEGFSSGEKLLGILRRYVRPSPARAPVDLRLVVTTSAGEVRACVGPPATTYEHVCAFDETTFASEEALEELFAGVVASCAFPLAFLPAPVRIRGELVPCFDGGLTNDSPIRYALDDPNVSRVFVISPFPRVAHAHPSDERGAGLLAHLADVLVNERLYRDLREARQVNAALDRLAYEFPTPYTRERVLAALGWEGRRQIEIVEIRPPFALEGNAFEGFFSRDLRESYVRAGEEAARAYLANLPAQQRTA